MNNLSLAIRTFFKRGRSNPTKIITLGAGLALGLTLLSKVLFNLSYNNYYPHSNNIYLVKSHIAHNDNKPEEWGQVSGAVAPGLSREVPGIKEATRFTYITGQSGTSMITEDKLRFNAVAILADSNFYNILPRPIIAGDVTRALTEPMQCIISSSIARKIGEDVIGKTIEPEGYTGIKVTIAAVFEELPENSSFKYDIAISMNSISSFFWDGRDNWDGNDRYRALVKLEPGTDPATLEPAVREMQDRHQNIERMKKAGVDLRYSFTKFKEYHQSKPEIKKMNYLMAFLSLILIVSSVFNYILISVTTLASRSKEIAVYKCHGARKTEIASLVFTETALHLTLSLIFSTIIILSFRNFAEELLSVSLKSLFNIQTITTLSLLCLLILLTAVAIPVNLFSNVPVSSVMKEFKIGGMKWKKILLFTQITFSAFLLTILTITVRQYNFMLDSHPGYNTENLYYIQSTAATNSDKKLIIDKLSTLPQIKHITSADALLSRGQSGNNVFLPGDNKVLFNIADLYNVGDNYIRTMEIATTAGIPPGPGYIPGKDIMVSRSFAEKITTITGWKDGVTGKDLYITEHGICTIKGIYKDIRIGSMINEDTRPSIMFYNPDINEYILIKTNKTQANTSKTTNTHTDETTNANEAPNTDTNTYTDETTNANSKSLADPSHMITTNTNEISTFAAIDTEIATIMQDKNYTLRNYKSDLLSQYRIIRNFRNSLMIGALFTLIITITGLTGFIKNEMYRRRLEISMRKIFGASNLNIYLIFTKEILKSSIPAAIIGITATAMLAPKILELFSDKTTLPITMYILIFIVIQLLALPYGLLTPRPPSHLAT